MKIALLTNFTKNFKEATNITILSFAKELKKNGHEAFIIAEGRQNLKKYELIGGIPVYSFYNFNKLRLGYLSSFLNRLFSYALTIKKLKKKGVEFDVLHGFSSSPVLVLRSLIAKVYARAKVVHTIKSYSKRKWGMGFAWLLNFTDLVTVQNKETAKALIKKGCKKSRIRIVHSHIDIEKFKPMNKKKIKAKYGYRGRKIILYYGAMRKEKGVDALIKAMPKIINNPVLIIASRVENYNKKYDLMIKNLENVKIITKDVDIVEYVNMADVVALPYPTLIGTEGNPSCLIESMAAKTAVVTSSLAELKEIVEDGKDVLMAKPGDIESLAREINKLLNDKKLQVRLTKNAYKKSKQFDVRLITKQFIDLYD